MWCTRPRSWKPSKKGILPEKKVGQGFWRVFSPKGCCFAKWPREMEGTVTINTLFFRLSSSYPFLDLISYREAYVTPNPSLYYAITLFLYSYNFFRFVFIQYLLFKFFFGLVLILLNRINKKCRFQNLYVAYFTFSQKLIKQILLVYQSS